jgi:hypothetical protein
VQHWKLIKSLWDLIPFHVLLCWRPVPPTAMALICLSEIACWLAGAHSQRDVSDIEMHSQSMAQLLHVWQVESRVIKAVMQSGAILASKNSRCICRNCSSYDTERSNSRERLPPARRPLVPHPVTSRWVVF